MKYNKNQSFKEGRFSMASEELKQIFSYTDEDLAINRKGKISRLQKKLLKEETSSAVRDLFYIAIVFPTVLIVTSTIILIIWLFLNSPELIPEIAIGSVVIGVVFYGVRKLLLKDLWDSSTVVAHEFHTESIISEPISTGDRTDLEDADNTVLYSNETTLPFHIPKSAESKLRMHDKLRVYYNPTHKRILSIEEI